MILSKELNISESAFKIPKKKLYGILLPLLLIGTFFQSMTVIRSGLIYPFGMGFWGPNGHDAVWHLALSNQVLLSFPPPNPVFSGTILTNYHYFFDIVLAFFGYITKIPLQNIYFQFFPIIFSFLIGFLSFLVGYLWSKNFWTGFWFTFLNYFAGSFGYLVTLFRSGDIGGESLFWSMQSISTQINSPFSLSLIVLLLDLYLLSKIKSFNIIKIIGIGILFGILINIKAYAGVIGLVSLFAFCLFSFIKRDHNRLNYFSIFAVSSLISFMFFLFTNINSASLFVFKPLWFVNSLLESPDRFYLAKVASARFNLSLAGFSVKLLLIEVAGLSLFLIGNFGTRIIGIFSFAKNIKKLTAIDVFLVTAIFIGILIPTFFIQKGTSWNTIQFFYYSLFFLNYFAAKTMSMLTERKIYLALSIIIILTIPTSISTLKDYFGWPPPSAIPKNELKALNFLKDEKRGNVFTFPYDEFKKREYPNTPLPLFVYESTAYVSAFSNKQTYLEDYMNMDITGFDWKGRKSEAEKFIIDINPITARGFLLNNNISYLYLTDGQKLLLSESDLGLNLIFDSDETKIYSVRGKI